MTHPALEMYNYHVWANQTMLNRLKELPQDVYNKEIQSVFLRYPRRSLIYTWWMRAEAMTDSAQMTVGVESKSIEEMEKMYVQISERFKTLLNQQENMEKRIVLDNPYTRPRETSLSEMVLQVVNHATYHRGNITAMLRQMGDASVMTEYALYWYS
ncbi:damage-inducible protein DinB [Paenibacillus frigoriresistens]|uniref:DinB family protein n=1 Tax=Paenibacillus alginolyticus TaxID=59839 RepID=UPI001565C893|nr:DinB family protein [Paenibacillus frigoriresistens]NRF90353.1 damage-inducible protein DinB [Paenibacillus frigoriresistens]